MRTVDDFLEPRKHSPPKYPSTDIEEIYPILENQEELEELLEVIKYGFELTDDSVVTEGAGRTAALIDNLEKAMSYYADNNSGIRKLGHGQANTLIRYLLEKGHLKKENVDRVNWDSNYEPSELSKIICHNHTVEVRTSSE